MFDPTITIGNIVAAVAFLVSAIGAGAFVKLRIADLTEAMKETTHKFETLHQKGCSWGQANQAHVAKLAAEHTDELRKTQQDRLALVEIANDIKWIKQKLHQL